MTITIRWFAIMLLYLFTSINTTQAQSNDELMFIEANVPNIVTLNDQTSILLNYNSIGNEVVTVTARNISDDDIDTVIEILYPDGERLAYNDDYIGTTLDLAQSDSALIDIVLREAGQYIIRVNSYGNIAVGEVEVLLVQVDPFQVVIKSDSGSELRIMVQLPAWMTYAYQFEAEVGALYTITARDINSQLDPYLTLSDMDSAMLAYNDDHGTNNATLNVFDSQIDSFSIPETGLYTIIVSDLTGNAGRIELVIIQENF